MEEEGNGKIKEPEVLDDYEKTVFHTEQEAVHTNLQQLRQHAQDLHKLKPDKTWHTGGRMNVKSSVPQELWAIACSCETEGQLSLRLYE